MFVSVKAGNPENPESQEWWDIQARFFVFNGVFILFISSCPCLFAAGFTDVIFKSETDQYLSQCALQPDVRAKELIEALERINRFDAANVVSRWLSSVHLADQALEMHKTRGESSSSVSSRRRGTSGASEHCEMRTRSNGGSNLSEGSSPLGSRYSLNSAREPCTCACPRHRFDSSEHSLPFSRDARASSYDSASHVASGPVQRLVNSEHKTRSSSLPSEHSCPTEESYCGSLTERLSCEESQINSTEQIVPQPRLFVDPCRNCEHCAPKLPVQETKGPKSRHSVQEMSNDRHTNRRDADLDFMSSPFQIAHNGVDEDFSKEESFATAETGEPDVKSRFPPSSMVPELSSRLSVSWRPVAFDLGFRRSQLGRFEESSLLRVQANQMLNFWLSNNSCSLGCRHCEEVILERLGEAFENAHRADLKDFLDNSKET